MCIRAINGDPLTREQRMTIVLGKALYLREDTENYNMNVGIMKKMEELVNILPLTQKIYQNEDGRPPYVEDDLGG